MKKLGMTEKLQRNTLNILHIFLLVGQENSFEEGINYYKEQKYLSNI